VGGSLGDGERSYDYLASLRERAAPSSLWAGWSSSARTAPSSDSRSNGFSRNALSVGSRPRPRTVSTV
jgi:hypothetical protein